MKMQTKNEKGNFILTSDYDLPFVLVMVAARIIIIIAITVIRTILSSKLSKSSSSVDFPHRNDTSTFQMQEIEIGV